MVTLRWLPAARSPEALPALHARPARPRSVLLIVDESVRADGDLQRAGRPGACDAAPAVNALLPDRFGFTAMRALDSTTALSIAALMTGQPPGERRDRLLSAPMLPEFAHAAGIDAAFWTAQNLLFANSGRFLDGLPLAAFVSGTEIAPVRDLRDGRRRRAAARPGARRRAPAPRAVPGDRAALEHALPVRRRRSRPAVLEPHRLAADGPRSGKRRFAIATRSTGRTSSSRAFSEALRARPDGARTVVDLPLGPRRAARRARAASATRGPCTTRRSACRCGSTRRPGRSRTARRPSSARCRTRRCRCSTWRRRSSTCSASGTTRRSRPGDRA